MTNEPQHWQNLSEALSFFLYAREEMKRSEYGTERWQNAEAIYKSSSKYMNNCVGSGEISTLLD